MSSISWLADLLASLIGSFDSREKGTAVVVLMTAVFLMLVWWCFWRHNRFRSQLQSGARTIDTALAEVNWSPADRLNAVTTTLDKNTVLGGSWNLYRSTLREDPRREGSFINLVEPRSWFTPDRLPGHGYEKWVATFASVFLTVGLMFTFIGLSAALFKVGDAGEDAVHLRQAINGILSVSSAKFITSIAGIAYFILWTLIARWIVSDQQKVAVAFATRVQRLTGMLSPEAILVDQLIASRQQTDRMRRLADDVAIAFEAKLTGLIVPHLAALPASVEASLKPVVQAIQDMGANIGDGAKQGIHDTVREMLDGMNAAAGREMRSVVEALRSAADELKSAQNSMGSSGDHFGSTLRGAAEGVITSVARMTDAIESKIGELGERISGVDEVLGRGASSMAGMSLEMSDAARTALQQALTSVSDEAVRAAEEARRQSQAHMEPILRELRDLVSEIRSTAIDSKDEIASGGKVAADTLTAAASALSDRLSTASSAVSTSINEAAASLTGRVNSAVEEFREVEVAIADHVRHLRQAGETINVAGNAFGTASERLRQAAEPVSTALEKVEASVRQATETLRLTSNTNDAMRDATTRLTEVSRTAGEAFSSYQSRFADTDRALGGTVKGLVDGSLQLSNQFGEIVSKLDTHLTQAVGSLSSGVEEIRSMAQELADAASELRQMLNDSDRVAAE